MSAGRSGAERLAAKFGRQLAALDHHGAGAVVQGLKPTGSVRRRDKAQPHDRLLLRTERAAGQLLSFQQDHIASACLDKLIGDGTAVNAAADDDGLGAIWQSVGNQATPSSVCG